MGKRGPKPLNSEQLRARGSPRWKARARDEDWERRQRETSVEPPDGLWDFEVLHWRALAEASEQSEVPADVCAYSVLAVLFRAYAQAENDHPRLAKHLKWGLRHVAAELDLDDEAWGLFDAMLDKAKAPAATNPRSEPDAEDADVS